MDKPIIYATIGTPYVEEQIVKKVHDLCKIGISKFRFNLSKCDDSNMEYLEDIIKKFQRSYSTEVNLMLDVPFPGRKVRISFPDDLHYVDFSRGQIVTIKYKKEQWDNGSKSIIYVDALDVCDRLSINQELVYSDGDCILVVEDINKNLGTVTARIINNVRMFARKSLSFNYISKNIITSKYIELLNRINPSAIAFSFVDNAESLEQCTRFLKNKDIEIISKIETESSIANLDEILELSNVMFARGDFILNSSIHMLYEYQEYVTKKAKEKNRLAYVATGILTSLHVQPIPAPADVSDLYLIMKNHPNGIIFNSDMVEGGNIGRAVKLINNIATSLS